VADKATRVFRRVGIKGEPMKKAYKVTTTGDGKERKEVKSEWKQGFLVVPAVDVFKLDHVKTTLEYFYTQTGRN
jgi:hypothetical protein